MDPSTKLEEWTTECALSLLMFEININNDFDPSEEYNGAYVGRCWSALRADVNAIMQMLMLAVPMLSWRKDLLLLLLGTVPR